MEALILACIFVAAYLIAFKPHKKNLALLFFCLSFGLSLFCWLMGTWGQIIPAGNL